MPPAHFVIGRLRVRRRNASRCKDKHGREGRDDRPEGGFRGGTGGGSIKPREGDEVTLWVDEGSAGKGSVDA
eukprot:scaffold107568_cov77-Phaeocystis_antarctica.AAC.2